MTVADVLPAATRWSPCAAARRMRQPALHAGDDPRGRLGNGDVLIGDVDAAVQDELSNTASVTAQTALINTENDSTIINTGAVAAGRSRAQRGAATVIAGEAIDYTITVVNQGPSDACRDRDRHAARGRHRDGRRRLYAQRRRADLCPRRGGGGADGGDQPVGHGGGCVDAGDAARESGHGHIHHRRPHPGRQPGHRRHQHCGRGGSESFQSRAVDDHRRHGDRIHHQRGQQWPVRVAWM
ncbi:MAG: hypothetical protein R2856_06785 [Caldilineaceae bacterium]